VLLESKDEIRKRIGRSPDRADAVVLAWYAGSDPFRGQQSRVANAFKPPKQKSVHVPNYDPHGSFWARQRQE
jgi:hypothetical protein